MSNHNYSQYSNKKKNRNVDSRNTGAAAQTVNSKPNIEDTLVKGVVMPEPENMTVKASSSDVKMVVETVETVILPNTVAGSIAGCAKLNVRSNPTTESDVLTVLDAKTEFEVDPARSTNEWVKVITADGIEGFCMRKFISAKV